MPNGNPATITSSNNETSSFENFTYGVGNRGSSVRIPNETEKNGKFICPSLVIATGGLSIPKIGASDFGYKIANQFKLKVTNLYPALVPLTF